MILRTMDNSAAMCIEAEGTSRPDAYLVTITVDVNGTFVSVHAPCITYMDIDALWTSLIDAMVPLSIDAAIILAEIADQEFLAIETAIESEIDKVRKGITLTSSQAKLKYN